MLLPLLSGFFLYLALPPASLWWLSFCALVPLFVFLTERKNSRDIVLGSFLTRFVVTVLFLSFVPEPFFILSTALWWVAFGILAWVGKRYVRSIPLYLLFLSVAYLAVEYTMARFGLIPGYIAVLGTALAPSPFLPLAKYTGLFGASFFFLLSNSLLTWWYLLHVRTKKFFSLPVLFILLFFVLSLSLSVWVRQTTPPEKSGMRVMTLSITEGFDSAIVSAQKEMAGNARSLKAESLLRAKLSDIASAVQEEKPDLVVFPQYMIDLELPNDRSEAAFSSLGITNSGLLLDAYAEFAQREKVSILASLTTQEKDGHKYSSAVLIDTGGHFSALYHKTDLIITSEYWPFGSWKPFYWDLEIRQLPPETRGDEFVGYNPTGPYTRAEIPYQPILADKELSLGILLCSEGQNPLAYETLRRKNVSFIIHATSDFWVTNFHGAYEKAVMNVRRIESVRTGVPVVVSGRGVYPSILSPDGSIKTAHMKGLWGYLTEDI